MSDLIKVSDRSLVFFDFETTGTTPGVHAICQIAAIRVDPKSLEIESEYVSLVKPFKDSVFTEDALAINRVRYADLISAPSEYNVMSKFVQGIRGAVLVGYNVSFDWFFLLDSIERNDLPLRGIPYHKIDVMSMCWPLLTKGKIESLALNAVCEYFGISNSNAHDALSDVKRTLAVYKKLVS